MTGVDRAILDFLHDHDVILTPRLLYVNLERELSDAELPSYSQVSRRIRILRTAGLVEHYKEGKYQLSEAGWQLLDDELPQDERLELATMSKQELEGDV